MALIGVEGMVSAVSAPVLLARLSSIEAVPSLVIDLTLCGFIDSSIIGILLRAHRRYDVPGRELYLVIAEGAVLRAMHVMRLDRLFRILPDRAALASCLGLLAMAA